MATRRPPEPRTQRALLGSELRQARVLRGLSGEAMGRLLGIQQRTVSRIERGQSMPTLAQVQAWAKETQVPADRRAYLIELARNAVREATVFRVRLRDGLAAVQRQVHEVEATAQAIRNFQPGFIPGLLQTPGYARHILNLSNLTGEKDVAEAVTARMARQEALQDPGRVFEFVITEATLRYRPGPHEMLTAQLDHVVEVAATTESVTLGVIPAAAEMLALVQCAFIIYEPADGRPAWAAVELPHRQEEIIDPADVKIYQDRLDAYRKSAVFGDEALALVRAIAHP